MQAKLQVKLPGSRSGAREISGQYEAKIATSMYNQHPHNVCKAYLLKLSAGQTEYSMLHGKSIFTGSQHD